MRTSLQILWLIWPILVCLISGIVAGFYDAAFETPSKQGLHMAYFATGASLATYSASLGNMFGPLIFILLIVAFLACCGLFVLPMWAVARRIARL